MKTAKDILKELKELISSETGLGIEEIKLNYHFEDDLNLDDFELANLFVSIEERFKIELGPRDIEKVKTVQDLVHLVEDNL